MVTPKAVRRRFILSTNRMSLLELGEDKLKICYDTSKYQFIALCDSPSPEKEGRFAQQKVVSGSFFAFHGSSPGNWYSIMRNGLKSLSSTSLMSAGAASGEGIYMASHFSTSYGSSCGFGSHVRGKSWGNGGLAAGLAVIAICEVINGSCRSNANGLYGGGVYVVPHVNEDNVAVRYIIVNGTNATYAYASYGSDAASFIKGSILCGSDSQTIDLDKHFYSIRKKYAANQWEKLNEQREEAMLKLKEEIPVEDLRREKQRLRASFGETTAES